MGKTEIKIKQNLEHAERWLNRANKDFNAFKRLVPFDRKTRKTVHCSDPALAVYLLQQSVEKMVKAAAIASGQYRTKDFVGYYKHNSLGLILNLNRKMADRIVSFGFGEMVANMGVDLVDGIVRLSDIENQVMGKPSSGLGTGGKKADFRKESVHVSAEVIDQILDMLTKMRSSLLKSVASMFTYLSEAGIPKGHETVDDVEAFARGLSGKIAGDLKVHTPTDAQIKAGIELNKRVGKYGTKSGGDLKRQEFIEDQLSMWAFSCALLMITYFTFAHESSSRYPQKPGTADKLGCDDYDYSLGIVNRLGRIGYMIGLTLNDMKPQLNDIALAFTYGKG
jgi:hypothetical protein